MTEYEAVLDREREHVSTFWSGRDQEEFLWMLGPINRTLPGFRVRRVRPSRGQDPWVYVSLGAWQATGDEPHGIEFFLLSPKEEALHVELLAMVANLHADPRYRLDTGSIIPIGRPWIDRSLADHFLLTLPYPFGPALEDCLIERHHIRFLWLVPITAGEAGVVSSQGVDALEDWFESAGINVVDPRRQTLA